MVAMYSWTVLLLGILTRHLTVGEFVCDYIMGDGLDTLSGCKQIDVGQICRDEVQPPICPFVESLYITELSKTSQRSRTPTTEEQLSITPVAHNCVEYNLTVSWISNITIQAGSTFSLELFEKSGVWYRTIFSQFTQPFGESFDGLSYEREFGIVQLTILTPNDSNLVISTEFSSPSEYKDIVPVSPYRCPLSDDEWKTPVINLSHTLTMSETEYNVSLSWEPPDFAAKYLTPVSYFVQIYHNKTHLSSAFHTDKTQMVISHLKPTEDHFIKVLPHVPCNSECGEGHLHTILSTPSAAPVITYIQPHSSTVIEVIWNQIPESDRNGIITHYELWYRVTNTSMYNLIETQNCSVNLSDLKANTMYEVSVRGFTTVGPGPFSEVLSNKTIPEASEFGSKTTIISVSVASILLVCVVFAVLIFLVIGISYKRKTKRPLPSYLSPKISLSKPNDHLCTSLSTQFESPPSTMKVTRSLSVGTFKLSGEITTDRPPSPTPSIRLCEVECVEALVVMSSRHPNKEQVLETLNGITQYRSNGAHIKLTAMDDETTVGMTAPLVLEAALERSRAKGRELCLLCVVGEEFMQEWPARGRALNSLVHTVANYVNGLVTYSQELTHFVILYEFEEQKEHVTPSLLKLCRSHHIKEYEQICRSVLREPEYILQQSVFTD